MEFLTYILKSAGILTLFYTIYLLVLRKDTFFTANRTYLLTGIIAALLLPFVTFTTTTIVEAPVVTEVPSISELASMNDVSIPAAAIVENSIEIWQIVFWSYCIGLAIMLLHFCIQLVSLLRLLRKYPATKLHGFQFVEINDAVAPFSFFNYIVYNPTTHDPAELEMILKHEKVHAAQWHSVDLLLANLLRALQWANPISWLYKSSLEANLEFLADNKTAQHVPSKTEYQIALLKASSSLPVPALTNNFYHSFIKKRIIMLNKSNSNKYNQLKLMLVVPALAVFLWSFNTVEVIAYESPIVKNVPETLENKRSKGIVHSFSAATTNEELNNIEAYFTKHHPESLVKIDNRKRNENGVLTNFSFKTKFTGNDRFYTRFDRGDTAPFQTVYKIALEEAGVIMVTEVGKDGMKFRITKENLELFVDQDQALNLDSKSAKDKQSNGLKTPVFGDNPLYIINGKDYYKKDLPEDKTIELDGSIETYNQKEGKEKYGDKGKDGVLLFDGTSTFIKAEHKDTPSQKVTDNFTFKITKNTTDSELEAIKNTLKKKHGFDFNYKVKRNTSNEITAISFNYSNNNGNNGSYSVSEDKPIEDTYFYKNEYTIGTGNGVYNKDVNKTAKGIRGIARDEKRETKLAKRAEARGKAIQKRAEKLERSRSELAKSRALLRDEVREEVIEERTALREEVREERMALREEVAELREKQRELMEEEELIEEQEIVENTFEYDTRTSLDIVINKNTTDAQLAAIKKELAAAGTTFNYSKLKRNAKGEITRIKILVNDGKGSKQTIVTNTHGGDPIDPIVIN